LMEGFMDFWNLPVDSARIKLDKIFQNSSQNLSKFLQVSQKLLKSHQTLDTLKFPRKSLKTPPLHSRRPIKPSTKIFPSVVKPHQVKKPSRMENLKRPESHFKPVIMQLVDEINWQIKN
jgi:hypothetical protein